jgi:hypothetical protein
LTNLAEIKPAGNWPEQKYKNMLPISIPTRNMLLILSDMYEKEDELSKLIQHFTAHKGEALLIHFMGKDELEFNYSGTLSFQDLETNDVIQLDATKVKKNYLEQINAFLQNVKRTALDNQMTYVQFQAGTDFNEAIFKFIKQRQNII